MSKRINASLLPNKSIANCFASSVLPTPVGPTNKKLPIGRLPSSNPARLRRMALETISTALSCPMILFFKRRLIFFKRSISLSSICDTGIPVSLSIVSETSWTVATDCCSFVPLSN